MPKFSNQMSSILLHWETWNPEVRVYHIVLDLGINARYCNDGQARLIGLPNMPETSYLIHEAVHRPILDNFGGARVFQQLPKRKGPIKFAQHGSRNCISGFD